jgi:hypothetical protein
MTRPHACTPYDLPLAVAAAHQACETLTGLACAEQDELWAAATAGWILVPTRSLPADSATSYPFARAPRERVELLLMRYAEAARASRQSADTVGEWPKGSGRRAGPSHWPGRQSLVSLIAASLMLPGCAPRKQTAMQMPFECVAQ